MRKLHFNKIKPTSGIFFKKESISVYLEENSISFGSISFLFFSGKYFFHSVEKETHTHIIYRALKADNEESEPNFDRLLFDEWHVYISKSGKRIMIYDNSNDGVILKS